MTGSRGRLRHHPGFRRFWAASTVSDAGTAVTTVALGWIIVTDLRGTAFDVGLVQAASTAPYLAVGLFVGVFADRVRRKPVLVGSDLGRALVLAAIPLLAAAGALTVGALMALMAVFGLFAVLNAAAHQSFLPRLLPAELLARGNARLDQSTAVATTAGPVLGGGLVGAVGAPLAVLVDAASYVASAVLVALTPIDDPRPRRASTSVLADLREGVRWVYGHPTLRSLALSTHAWFVFHAGALAVYLPFAVVVLGLDPVQLGVTFAVAGLGALLGTSTSEWLMGRLGVAATVVGARLLEGAGFALVATAGVVGPALVVGCVGQFVYGIGFGVEGPVEMSYRQAVTPDRLQGRMNATMRSFNRACIVVGAPLGGLLADAVGPRDALAVAAGGVAGAGLALLVSGFRAARPTDRPPPEP